MPTWMSPTPSTGTAPWRWTSTSPKAHPAHDPPSFVFTAGAAAAATAKATPKSPKLWPHGGLSRPPSPTASVANSFPAQIHDCKAAVRFLRANAPGYGIDPDNIGAIGLSAGGHLVALLATSGDVPELEGDGGNPNFSSRIWAAIPMGAQTDFLSVRTREVSKAKEIWQKFLGGHQQEKLETYRLASPLQHLCKGDPPTWFITGGNDDPSTQAEKFRKASDSLGIPAQLTVIDGAPWIPQPARMVRRNGR